MGVNCSCGMDGGPPVETPSAQGHFVCSQPVLQSSAYVHAVGSDAPVILNSRVALPHAVHGKTLPWGGGLVGSPPEPVPTPHVLVDPQQGPGPCVGGPVPLPACDPETGSLNVLDHVGLYAPVVLHIYNVGHSPDVKMLNNFLRSLGSGAWHVGIEVFGKEWSFNGTPSAKGHGTGIHWCFPRRCASHSYSDSYFLGKTALSRPQCEDMLSVLRQEWPASEYNLLRRNCAHFCDEFCQLLGVGSLPVWLMSLAGAAETISNAEEAVQQHCSKVATHVGKCPRDAQHCCTEVTSCVCKCGKTPKVERFSI